MFHKILKSGESLKKLMIPMKQEISNALNCKSIFSCKSNILQTDCRKKGLANSYPPLVIWLLNRKAMFSKKLYFSMVLKNWAVWYFQV